MTNSLDVRMADATSLEQLSKIADAELGVAEELGWAIAILFAAVVQFLLSSWVLSIAGGFCSYVFAVYRYRKRAAIAEDNYFKAAGLGKYFMSQDQHHA
jgi:cbb3-type cytochrome oxidase subunit 3